MATWFYDFPDRSPAYQALEHQRIEWMRSFLLEGDIDSCLHALAQSSKDLADQQFADDVAAGRLWFLTPPESPEVGLYLDPPAVGDAWTNLGFMTEEDEVPEAFRAARHSWPSRFPFTEVHATLTTGRRVDPAPYVARMFDSEAATATPWPRHPIAPWPDEPFFDPLTLAEIQAAMDAGKDRLQVLSGKYDDESFEILTGWVPEPEPRRPWWKRWFRR